MANLVRAAAAAKLLKQETVITAKPLLVTLKDGLGATSLNSSVKKITINIKDSEILRNEILSKIYYKNPKIEYKVLEENEEPYIQINDGEKIKVTSDTSHAEIMKRIA